MLPPAVDEAAASSGLRSSVGRRLGLHQRPFWGVFYGFVGLPESNPREKTELAFWFERHVRLLVGDNVSRPLRTRRFHRQAFFMQIAPPAVGIAS